MDVEDYRGTPGKDLPPTSGCQHVKWIKNTIGQYVCERCLVKKISTFFSDLG